MSKIFIFADDTESDAIKNAVRVLQAACDCQVVVERPVPAALLSIALGLLPNMGAEVVDDGVAELEPQAASDELPDDQLDTNADDVVTPKTPEDAPGDISDVEGEVAVSDDDFNFESLGMVNIDGELVEAFRGNGETSSLFVMKSGPSVNSNQIVYKINESTFSFFPVISGKGGLAEHLSRCYLATTNGKVSSELSIRESKREKPYLLVGKDHEALKQLFN